MFSKTKILKSTTNYWGSIKDLKNAIESADGIVIGAGSGLSTSAGLTYDGKRFYEHFSDFAEKYGMKDMYSAGFYPFETLEEYWAYWSRHIYYNRYDNDVGKPYFDLLEIVKDKDHFVLTTNVDHCFQKAGFDKHRLFYTQGDYGLWQCSKPCHDKTYDNKEIVEQMITAQKDMKIPSELIPYCPHCGAPMTMNLRVDSTFVQDEGWYSAYERYQDFLNRHDMLKILFLELGVGANTPGIIKYPFWQMVASNKSATYACINYGEGFAPQDMKERSICIDGDIGKVLADILAQ